MQEELRNEIAELDGMEVLTSNEVLDNIQVFDSTVWVLNFDLIISNLKKMLCNSYHFLQRLNYKENHYYMKYFTIYFTINIQRQK